MLQTFHLFCPRPQPLESRFVMDCHPVLLSIGVFGEPSMYVPLDLRVAGMTVVRTLASHQIMWPGFGSQLVHMWFE